MKLTLANAPAPRVSGSIPAESRAQHNFAALAHAYHALPITAKGTWQLAANALNDAQGRTGRHRLTPMNAFSIVNSGRLPFNLPLLTDAPADLAPPPMLPPVEAQANTATGDANADFTLSVTAPAYPHPVQVLAAPPAPAGKPTYPDAAFLPIATLPGLSPAAPTDLGPAYQSRYGVPEPGSQIALKLIAISPAGVRGLALLLAPTVPAPNAAPLRLA